MYLQYGLGKLLNKLGSRRGSGRVEIFDRVFPGTLLTLGNFWASRVFLGTLGI